MSQNFEYDNNKTFEENKNEFLEFINADFNDDNLEPKIKTELEGLYKEIASTEKGNKLEELIDKYNTITGENTIENPATNGFGVDNDAQEGTGNNDNSGHDVDDNNQSKDSGSYISNGEIGSKLPDEEKAKFEQDAKEFNVDITELIKDERNIIKTFETELKNGENISEEDLDNYRIVKEHLNELSEQYVEFKVRINNGEKLSENEQKTYEQLKNGFEAQPTETTDNKKDIENTNDRFVLDRNGNEVDTQFRPNLIANDFFDAFAHMRNTVRAYNSEIAVNGKVPSGSDVVISIYRFTRTNPLESLAIRGIGLLLDVITGKVDGNDKDKVEAKGVELPPKDPNTVSPEKMTDNEKKEFVDSYVENAKFINSPEGDKLAKDNPKEFGKVFDNYQAFDETIKDSKELKDYIKENHNLDVDKINGVEQTEVTEKRLEEIDALVDSINNEWNSYAEELIATGNPSGMSEEQLDKLIEDLEKEQPNDTTKENNNDVSTDSNQPETEIKENDNNVDKDDNGNKLIEKGTSDVENGEKQIGKDDGKPNKDNVEAQHNNEDTHTTTDTLKPEHIDRDNDDTNGNENKVEKDDEADDKEGNISSDEAQPIENDNGDEATITEAEAEQTLTSDDISTDDKGTDASVVDGQEVESVETSKTDNEEEDPLKNSDADVVAEGEEEESKKEDTNQPETTDEDDDLEKNKEEDNSEKNTNDNKDVEAEKLGNEISQDITDTINEAVEAVSNGQENDGDREQGLSNSAIDKIKEKIDNLKETLGDSANAIDKIESFIVKGIENSIYDQLNGPINEIQNIINIIDFFCDKMGIDTPEILSKINDTLDDIKISHETFEKFGNAIRDFFDSNFGDVDKVESTTPESVTTPEGVTCNADGAFNADGTEIAGMENPEEFIQDVEMLSDEELASKLEHINDVVDSIETEQLEHINDVVNDIQNENMINENPTDIEPTEQPVETETGDIDLEHNTLENIQTPETAVDVGGGEAVVEEAAGEAVGGEEALAAIIL